MTTYDDIASELPRLRVSFEFFDVKFCPYQPLDCDPIFAAVSKKHVVICRLSQNSGDANPCAILNVIRDDDVDASACCCTWTRDPETQRPLICIGGVDAKVKIYDVLEGKLFKCFTGHGSDVNDLATSPSDSSIIASASDDTSVRIWSIDPKHKDRPCLCILAGEGHSWNLLSVAFHDTGRYILSAGHDQIINLWTLPDLPTEPITTPIRVHYPHFSTSAVHSGIVDCVAFYGDQILSRACHDNVISLWRIEGFSSDGPPPAQSIAPTPQNIVPTNYDEAGRLTRSGFVPTISPQCPAQYTRVLDFHTPNCGPQFFMRFKLHFVPGQHPVLAFCNAGGNIFFWDFKRLTVYSEFMESLRNHDSSKGIPPRPSWLRTLQHRQKAEAGGKSRPSVVEKGSPILGQVDEAAAPKSTDDIKEFNDETLESWTAKYCLEDAHEPLKAHKTESSSANFVGRQAAWSPGGEWCVIVGSSNTALILQRWAKKTPAKTAEHPKEPPVVT
ncbi:WD40-repeat-containing domain protein [Dactylonectria macrodidyma]|uniref:WD40-repeat-containing domain protein n=1 Tax=Dactylonectria macrodidyma TaxID=307937 RepID=A0A9P9ISD2_9HYPO|nr:WD40-repeat-containing domain protein [Dactylonectria macrodidyma]